MADEFVWKTPKDIWKGVGIYHLTFNVAGRKRMLEEIVGVPNGGETTVERSGNMNATLTDMNAGHFFLFKSIEICNFHCTKIKNIARNRLQNAISLGGLRGNV